MKSKVYRKPEDIIQKKTKEKNLKEIIHSYTHKAEEMETHTFID